MEVGCASCDAKNRCIDAFSAVSPYCGAYDKREVTIFKEGIIYNGDSGTETEDKE